MIENKEEIVLDNANNVFVGPNGYFKLVVDQFDGKTVKAWHLEDSKGNETVNLSSRAKGTNVDVLVNAKCRTVSHFIGRIANDLIAEQQAELNALKASK